MLVLSSRRLVHPAADGDFVIFRKARYGQELVLPSRRLMCPAADDDFVTFLQIRSYMNLNIAGSL